MRQIVLDTETTGLEPKQGHRIIEIGCVELVNRRLTGRHFHQYLNPEREIEQGAIEVHGITNEFLADKPLYAQVHAEFLAFIAGAELIIHNAAFDIGFIENEWSLLGAGERRVLDHCQVIDTLLMARQKHPGQRNSLDALCQRYMVDNTQREWHGALLDAEILAEVYLAMTGGQTHLSLSGDGGDTQDGAARTSAIRRVSSERKRLKIVRASAQELAEHETRLADIDKASGGPSRWRTLESGG